MHPVDAKFSKNGKKLLYSVKKKEKKGYFQREKTLQFLKALREIRIVFGSS